MTRPGSVIVLGIDPGLSFTGFGVVLAEGSSHQSVRFGALSIPSAAPRPEKLIRIYEGLGDVIRETKPQEVAIEDFVGGYMRSAVAIGEARAAAVLASANAGLPVSYYKPAEVKQFVTSYGRGSKEQVGMMVQALLGLSEPPTPADAADALAVALCHCLKRGSMAGLDDAVSPRGASRPVVGARRR